MSLLPELTPLASIILAFNIAYLRLDQFRHQERVRQYARDKLKEITKSRAVPDTASNSESYNALLNLAEKPRGKAKSLSRFWSLTYAVLLRTRIDRWAASILVLVGLTAVCVGSAHAVDHWQSTAPWFVSEHISWWLWGLTICCSLSVLFAILGELIVRGTLANIDKYASEPMSLMQQKTTGARVQ